MSIVFSAAPSLAQKGCLVVTTSTEVEQSQERGGKKISRLAPAEKVLPGVEVIYTVSAANICDQPAIDANIDRAIPAHMRYVAYSAVAPNADVSFSVDGGFHYGKAERLQVVAADGTQRLAVASDYTHIRWTLLRPLAPGAVVIARFRAVFGP